MRPWWIIAADRIAERRACVLVTVCHVEGSAPREAGAKMLVWSDGQDGTVGGGNLEFTIVEQARRMLDGDAAWRFQNYPLGPLLGQCCGGRVGILLERLGADSRTWLEEIAALEKAGRPYAVTSRLMADNVAKQFSLVDATATQPESPVMVRNGSGVASETIARRIGENFTIVERIDARPCLMLFGAGHVGQAFAAIAATLPFQLHWFDTRAEFGAPGVEIVDDPLTPIDLAPPGSFYLVFTQSHVLDYELVRAILRRGDFHYCGLIGSATKRARFEKRLIADGIPRDRLARLTSPIGRIGLTSKVPQVMAVGIAAELLLVQEALGATHIAPQRIGTHHGG